MDQFPGIFIDDSWVGVLDIVLFVFDLVLFDGFREIVYCKGLLARASPLYFSFLRIDFIVLTDQTSFPAGVGIFLSVKYLAIFLMAMPSRKRR